MYLKIKVVPDSKSEKIERRSEDEWRIWTKKPAEQNLANNHVIEILKQEFPNQQIRLVSGHHSPSKIFSIGNG